MAIDVFALLRENPILLIFTVIGLGYLVAGIRIASVPVGPVIGVLLVALLFGHFGFGAPPGASSFGFAIFIFSVGIQAGPTFFSAFAADGLRYVTLACVVAATAVALSLVLARIMGLEHGLGAGMLAGALTSTPALAGAQDAVRSGLATLPEAVSQAQALKDIGVGYAITYVFGTLGMILVARLFPRIAGIDLPGEAAKLAHERGLGRGRHRGPGGGLPIIRAYRLPASMVGKTVAQVDAETGHLPGKVLRIKRGPELLEGAPELVLEAGDLVSIIAGIGVHLGARGKDAEEVLEADLLSYQVTTRDIILTNVEVVGKTLEDLDMPNTYGCFATGLTRASIDLPVDPSLPLQKGDRLEVVGEHDSLLRLAQAIGFVEQDLEKTDLATFAFGMIAGTLLGLVTLTLGEVSIGLGIAGGLLVAGILIGYLGSVMPTFGRVPAAARYMLMELGLMLFMAGVGLNAGGGVVAALASVGPVLVIGGMLVTLLPPVVAYLFGRWVLHMNPALLLGAVTGAMTSTAAMNVVTEAAGSSVPALGYAGTYTFANVLLTFAGALMMAL